MQYNKRYQLQGLLSWLAGRAAGTPRPPPPPPAASSISEPCGFDPLSQKASIDSFTAAVQDAMLQAVKRSFGPEFSHAVSANLAKKKPLISTRPSFIQKTIRFLLQRITIKLENPGTETAKLAPEQRNVVRFPESFPQKPFSPRPAKVAAKATGAPGQPPPPPTTGVATGAPVAGFYEIEIVDCHMAPIGWAIVQTDAAAGYQARVLERMTGLPWKALRDK